MDSLVNRNVKIVTSDTVESIGNYAFYGCSNLLEANMPNVKRIGHSAFAGNYALTKVNYPLASTIDQQTFYCCINLIDVNLPLVWTLGTETFHKCYRLRKLDFMRVNTINESVFNSCKSLTMLVLRSNTKCRLRSANAFTDCCHMLGAVDETYNPDGLHDGYVYVPSALVASYQADSVWTEAGVQFRALEKYTVDETVTGDMDWDKINGNAEATSAFCGDVICGEEVCGGA